MGGSRSSVAGAGRGVRLLRTRRARLKMQRPLLRKQHAHGHEALVAMEVEAAHIAKMERQAVAVAEAVAAAAATLRLDATDATDSEANLQMELQTPDVRAVLQACDSRVALARLGTLHEDDWSWEVERDLQRRSDRAGRYQRWDRDRDSDLDSVPDSIVNTDLDSTWVRGGEQARRRAIAAWDREAEHGGGCTWEAKALVKVSAVLDAATTASSATARRSGYLSRRSDV